MVALLLCCLAGVATAERRSLSPQQLPSCHSCPATSCASARRAALTGQPGSGPRNASPCLRGSCHSSTTAAKTDDDSTLPPLVGTWAVGQRVAVPSVRCHTTGGSSVGVSKFEFRPRGSASTISCVEDVPTFTPDRAGDFVVASSSSAARVAAVDFATLDDLSLHEAFIADHFGSSHVKNSDAMFAAWGTNGYGQLVSRAPVLNFCAQPLNFQLRGLSVSKTGTFELGLLYRSENKTREQQGEGLIVEVTCNSMSLRIKGGRSCDKGTRCTLASKPLPRCQHYSLSLVVNGGQWGGNATIVMACNGDATGANVSIAVPHRLLLPDAPPSPFGMPSGDVAISLAATESSSGRKNKAAAAVMPCAARRGHNSTLELGSCASLSSIEVHSLFDGRTLPRVMGDTMDWLPLGNRVTRLGPVHANNLRRGLLDVTLPPFSVDKTGNIDATTRLQHAIDYAYRNYLVVYLPIGRYLVSDTLNATQYNRYGSMGTRFAAIAIQGELRTMEPRARATLFLADDSASFTSILNGTKPVLNMWHEQTVTNAEGDTDTGAPQSNINMNQRASSFDIDLGHRNYAAVGAVNRGAQGATLQGLTVYANDGFAGIQVRVL